MQQSNGTEEKINLHIILMANGYWNKKILQQVPTHIKETLGCII